MSVLTAQCKRSSTQTTCVEIRLDTRGQAMKSRRRRGRYMKAEWQVLVEMFVCTFILKLKPPHTLQATSIPTPQTCTRLAVSQVNHSSHPSTHHISPSHPSGATSAGTLESRVSTTTRSTSASQPLRTPAYPSRFTYSLERVAEQHSLHKAWPSTTPSIPSIARVKSQSRSAW
jgi:hypothetical protein